MNSIVSIKKTLLIEKKNAGEKSYLELPAIELLDAFGQGSHIPGSGSAAALTALMAIELMKTVLQLTLSKTEYKKHHKEFEIILNKISTDTKKKFTDYFNIDIKIFHEVSYHRRLRDKATDETIKNEHKNLANEKLREATDIPFLITDSKVREVTLVLLLAI
jgi:formiminotetrahydrofolate cyclodeaminase